MSTDWNSQWLPPGAQQPAPADPQSTSSGWEWPSWLTPEVGDASKRGRGEYPGSAYYQEHYPGVDLGKLWQQLTTPDPETQLAQLIAEKMGLGSSGLGATRNLKDAYLERIARDAAHRAMTDPSYRDQLAQSMGWDLKNPHVAYWIQHGGGIPKDPTGPGVTSTGQGKPGTTTSTTAAGAPSTIGAPFAANAWKGRAGDPGFTYGAVLPPDIAAAAGIDRQWGVDYAIPEGTQLPSMFAGTIVEAGWNGPYGNTVVVKQANGYTYRVAHLESLNVKVGDTVAVGQLLGLSGNTGNSFGAHLLVEMRDAQGHPIDPTPIIDAALKGDFSATTGAQKYMNDYVTAAQSAGPILTSDGHLLYPGSQDYNVFFAAQTLWRKRYGVDPPWTFVSSLLASGQTTTEQVQNAMDEMSSDIPNMNWGQRDTLTNDVNNAAMKAWDRPVPDSTVKQLAALGITTPGQVAGWVNSHAASGLGADYGQVFDAAAPQTKELWGQPPSPELVKHIHDQMQAGPQ